MVVWEQFMSEAEVWYIFDMLVNISVDLLAIGYPHDFINPENIFINQDCTIKLLDSMTLKKEKVLFKKYQVALSPEECLNLKNARFKISRIKCIVWAIGLTTLCIATMTEPKSFYLNGDVNVDFLSKKLEKIKKLGFSEAFCEVIGLCLALKDDERVSLKSLSKFLKGEEEEEEEKPYKYKVAMTPSEHDKMFLSNFSKGM